ncbi:MAG: ATP-binding protein [Simkaniaceae bacterium]|nr:ATP-binding protein [Candidatus Sacchlamyda saccharinae]
MNKPKNPFRFGDPVAGDYFLPRPELENAVSQFLENRIHVVLNGPRRLGKTSFVLNLLEKFEEEKYTCFFVDIFNITSHRDFLQQVLRSLRQKKRWKSQLLEILRSIPQLRPKFSADVDAHTGQQSLGFSLDTTSEKDVKELIQDVLSSLAKLSGKVIFVIDEFQKIAEIDDQGWLEATLRTHMQQLKNTSFLFTGSRKSIIYDMLNNASRPLYRSCQLIEFPTFGLEFDDWVLHRFESVGISCEKVAITHLRDLVQNIPNYVQMVCFHLVARNVEEITKEEVEKTLKKVARQNSYTYQTLLNTLSKTQQRTLRLAATEKKQLFAKEFLARYEIASTPALASSLKSLKEKKILDEEGASKGSVIFDDPLFAYWLSLQAFASLV